MRLTLRTLLAYLDDTLPAAEAREIGQKVAENAPARELVERIKRVTRRRGLSTPPIALHGTPSDPNDPNTVADYLSDTLTSEQIAQFEKTCLESDVHLAEVAACHQILTLVLSDQVRVPPTARQRMYQLVKGPEAIPHRRPGKTIPVGGVIGDQGPIDSDDTEAGLLLGMPAYTGREPAGRRALRLAAVAGLLAVLAVAVFLAWPAAERYEPAAGPVSLAGTTKPPVVPRGLEVVAAPRLAGAAVTDPGVSPETKGGTDPAGTTATGQDTETGPKKDLVPTVPAPRPDRVALGGLEKPAGVVPIVVRQTSAPDRLWSRVMIQEPTVFSSERLTALPGYRAQIRLDPGVSLELWGNLPDLVPNGIYETSITPWLPVDGFHADFTVHTGRVYVSNQKTSGSAQVRIRFLSEVWDVTLPEPKSEVIFELSHQITPGIEKEPPQSTAGLAVLSGTATVKLRYGDPQTLARGDDLAWDSKGGRPEVRPAARLDARARSDRAAYLARVPLYLDATRAKLTLQVLDEFSRALTDPSKVRATFLEALQDKPVSDQVRAAARVAVFSFASLGDLTGLGDALTDHNRPLVRQTAAEGLRHLFAVDPDAAAQFRHVLVDKYQLKDDEADAVILLVRGFNERERTQPATLDRLAEGLTANSVAVRELSFMNLAALVGPMEKSNSKLFSYDAGAPDEFRDPIAAEWRARVKELKAKSAPEVAPPPMKK